jgi:hypothetical protein
VQLTDLITLTRTNLTRADRTRVMVMVTMDAHARDIIAGLVKGRIMSPTAFQWQSQLKQRLQVCVRLLGAQRLFVGTRRRPMHLGMVSIPTAWRTSN